MSSGISRAYWYTREIPVVMEWSPKIATWQEELASMSWDEPRVKKLEVMAYELVRLVESLQPTLVKPFINNLVSCTMAFSKNELNGGPRDVITAAVQSVLGELAIQFPLDKKLCSEVEALALRVQALQTESQTEQLAKVAKLFMSEEEPKGDGESSTKKLEHLQQLVDMCAKIPVAGNKKSAQEVDEFVSLFDEIVAFVKVQFLDKKGGQYSDKLQMVPGGAR